MANYLDKSGLLRVLRGVNNQIERKVGELETTKGRPNGIASLDSKGFVPLAQLGNLDMNFFEAVQELPTKDIKKHIYLIKNNKEGKQDTYDEFIYTGDVDGEYDSTKWEKLGDFVPTFDLKEYAKKGEVVSSMKFSQEEGCRVIYTLADGNTEEAVIPLASAQYEYPFFPETDITARSKPAGNWVYRDGVMSGSDKHKLDQIDTTALSQSISNANTAADNTNEAIRKCETATAGAEKVDATLTEGNIFEVTDRTGAKKTLDLNITAEGSVDNAVGTPSVEITQSVENNKQKLYFNFKNIKGEKGEKGDIGDKGDAFTYDDFTPEQLKILQDKVVESSKEVAMVEVNKYTDLVKLPNIEVPVSGDTVTLEPNKVYNIAIGESLTLALTPPTDTTITNEYQCSFDTGATAPTVTFPADVIWAETPSVEANMHYEFNIRYIGGKYYGLMQDWILNTEEESV